MELQSISQENPHDVVGICAAAQDGNIEYLKSLLDTYCNTELWCNPLSRTHTTKSENIMHLILKRPNLSAGQEKLEEITWILKYAKCAHLLLSKCNRKVLLAMVNQQDDDGNTPLHYAVRSWPLSTVKQHPCILLPTYLAHSLTMFS